MMMRVFIVEEITDSGGNTFEGGTLAKVFFYDGSLSSINGLVVNSVKWEIGIHGRKLEEIELYDYTTIHILPQTLILQNAKGDVLEFNAFEYLLLLRDKKIIEA